MFVPVTSSTGHHFNISSLANFPVAKNNTNGKHPIIVPAVRPRRRRTFCCHGASPYLIHYKYCTASVVTGRWSVETDLEPIKCNRAVCPCRSIDRSIGLSHLIGCDHPKWVFVNCLSGWLAGCGALTRFSIHPPRELRVSAVGLLLFDRPQYWVDAAEIAD